MTPLGVSRDCKYPNYCAVCFDNFCYGLAWHASQSLASPRALFRRRVVGLAPHDWGPIMNSEDWNTPWFKQLTGLCHPLDGQPHKAHAHHALSLALVAGNAADEAIKTARPQFDSSIFPGPVRFSSGKFAAAVEYQSVDEVFEDAQYFLELALESLSALHALFINDLPSSEPSC